MRGRVNSRVLQKKKAKQDPSLTVRIREEGSIGVRIAS